MINKRFVTGLPSFERLATLGLTGTIEQAKNNDYFNLNFKSIFDVEKAIMIKGPVAVKTGIINGIAYVFLA